MQHIGQMSQFAVYFFQAYKIVTFLREGFKPKLYVAINLSRVALHL